MGPEVEEAVQREDIRKSDARRLASLLDMDPTRRLWQPAELNAVLLHQLSAPVQFDLGRLDSDLARKIGPLCEAEQLLVRSFDDLFCHPHPPIELLTLTKDFAKANSSHPESPLPREIATLLYYTSIVVAMMRCRQRITKLSDDAIRHGIKWVLDQPWINDRIRSIFCEAREFLGGKPPDES